jgi:antitoxin MazE
MIKDHGTLKKWGAGGLCFPISKTVRQILHLEEGTPVKYTVTAKGFYVEPEVIDEKPLFPMSLDELVKGLTPEKAHTDLLSTPLDSEIPDYE